MSQSPDTPENKPLAGGPVPTAADRLAAATLLAALGQVAHLPKQVVYAVAAECVMEQRLVIQRALEKRAEAVREAAIALLVELHHSAGHAVPPCYPKPSKPLHELLNDLETALFPAPAPDAAGEGVPS